MTSTKPKPYVFVLMPFSNDFDDVYQLGIKPACIDAGAYCERVDEQIFQESILERIYNQIGKADIVVADMTDRNPNVFYETGYAHALGKRVVLLTRNADDIPFDLQHYPHIVYSGKIAYLKSELNKRIAWYVENPKKDPSRIEFNLEVFMDGKPLADRPIVLCKWIWVPGFSKGGIVLQLDIHNPLDRMYSGICSMGITTPPYCDKNLSGAKTVRLPDNRYQHLLPEIPRILPKGWESVSTVIVPPSWSGGELETVINIYTEVENKRFEILLRYEQTPFVG